MLWNDRLQILPNAKGKVEKVARQILFFSKKVIKYEFKEGSSVATLQE